MNTTTGPAVAWLNDLDAITEIRVQKFDGTNWLAVGTTVAASASDLSDLAFTTDGSKLAIAWSQPVASVSRVHALEFAGTSWQELAGSATGNGVSPSLLPGDQPALAYHDRRALLCLATVHTYRIERDRDSRSPIYRGIWTEAGEGGLTGGGISATGGVASQPRLAVGGDVLHLAWAEDLVSRGLGSRNTIYSKRWNGTAFTERFNRSGDIAGGISSTGDGLQALSLAVNSAAQPFVAWSNSDTGSPQVYIRGDTLAVNRVMYTSASISLQSVLEFNTMMPGDIVVIDATTETAPATLTAAHSGIFIVGSGQEFSRIEGLLTLDNVDDITISGVDLAGGVHGVDGRRPGGYFQPHRRQRPAARRNLEFTHRGQRHHKHCDRVDAERQYQRVDRTQCDLRYDHRNPHRIG